LISSFFQQDRGEHHVLIFVYLFCLYIKELVMRASSIVIVAA